MILVEKPKLNDQDGWNDLVLKANAERLALIKAFRNSARPQVDDGLYKKYKAYLLVVFNDKCAYCESLITDTQPGDVEHFRPKGRVVGPDFKPIKAKYRKWGEIDHPGYFWLAYDWDNLLPSCIDCNRYRRHDAEGAGKADRFPVEDEILRARLPGQERRERALLINPCKIDPSEHLEFLPDGKIEAKTPAGSETLAIFGLNVREQLVRQRARAHRQATRLVKDFVNGILFRDRDVVREAVVGINAIWGGSDPHSAIQRIAVKTMAENFRAAGVAFDLPLKNPFDGAPNASPVAG